MKGQSVHCQRTNGQNVAGICRHGRGGCHRRADGALIQTGFVHTGLCSWSRTVVQRWSVMLSRRKKKGRIHKSGLGLCLEGRPASKYSSSCSCSEGVLPLWGHYDQLVQAQGRQDPRATKVKEFFMRQRKADGRAKHNILRQGRHAAPSHRSCSRADATSSPWLGLCGFAAIWPRQCRTIELATYTSSGAKTADQPKPPCPVFCFGKEGDNRMELNWKPHLQ